MDHRTQYNGWPSIIFIDLKIRMKVAGNLGWKLFLQEPIQSLPKIACKHPHPHLPYTIVQVLKIIEVVFNHQANILQKVTTKQLR